VRRAPWRGAVCMKGIYFERNVDARQNIYLGRHFVWLNYFTYHLVPVLALNYKQHILSPAEDSFFFSSQHAD
jgi:hypothetical protein